MRRRVFRRARLLYLHRLFADRLSVMEVAEMMARAEKIGERS